MDGDYYKKYLLNNSLISCLHQLSKWTIHHTEKMPTKSWTQEDARVAYYTSHILQRRGSEERIKKSCEQCAMEI
jgi:hypothetical protein